VRARDFRELLGTFCDPLSKANGELKKTAQALCQICAASD
jgi:hypothetical protein